MGGAETLLKSLAERAAARGVRVTFLTTCAESHFTWENTLPEGTSRAGDLEVRRFPVDENRDVASFLRIQRAICNRGDFAPADEETWLANSVNSRALLDHLSQNGNKYDRIIAGPYLFGLTYYASLIHPRKTLLVPCLHDEPFAYLGIMRRLFEGVAGLMFNTEPERDLARRLFNIEDRKFAVVGMGLEPFDVSPDAFALRRKISWPYVMYSGRREAGKGTPLICDYIQTFRERTGRDVKLVFTGSGPIDAPPELQKHVIDLGFVTDHEKQEAMAGAVAFIHPSVNESLGIVLLESWLARTPALVHANGAVLSWQCRKSGGGLWFRNYPDFEEELVLLLDNPALRRMMGEAGRRYVLDAYSWSSAERRFFNAINSI